MLDWLDSDGLRVAGYFAVALAALWAGRRERRGAKSNPNLWPAFWFLTAALFALMAIGRVVDFGGLATKLGRTEAREHGWYFQRQHVQKIIVASLAGLWFIFVAVALWRVWDRRRRYLPMAVITVSLMCYAAVRVVSLHQIDTVLYRRSIAGARIDAAVELLGLAVAFAATFFTSRSPTVGSLFAADVPIHDPTVRGRAS
jgi:hypothetical protein